MEKKVRVTELVALMGKSLFESPRMAAERIKLGRGRELTARMAVGAEIEKAIAIVYLERRGVREYYYNYPLEMDFEGWVITGKCDLWAPKDGLLAEFKFTLSDPGVLTPMYTYQLALYEYLLRKGLGLDGFLRKEIFYLSQDGFLEYEVEGLDFGFLEAEVRAALGFLEGYDVEEVSYWGLTPEQEGLLGRLKFLREERRRIEGEIDGLEAIVKQFEPGEYRGGEVRVRVSERESSRVDMEKLKSLNLPSDFYKVTKYKTISFL